MQYDALSITRPLPIYAGFRHEYFDHRFDRVRFGHFGLSGLRLILIPPAAVDFRQRDNSARS